MGKKLFVGKIVNTFGIKGELKVVSSFEAADRVFMVNNLIYIKDVAYKISGVRFHKNNYLVEVNGIKDINLIEYLIGNDIYFDMDDLNLTCDEYLISELIDYEVYSDDKLIGKVTDYDDNKINPLIKVNNKFYIPLKGNFVKNVDKDKKIIYTTLIDGLM